MQPNEKYLEIFCNEKELPCVIEKVSVIKGDLDNFVVTKAEKVRINVFLVMISIIGTTTFF